MLRLNPQDATSTGAIGIAVLASMMVVPNGVGMEMYQRLPFFYLEQLRCCTASVHSADNIRLRGRCCARESTQPAEVIHER